MPANLSAPSLQPAARPALNWHPKRVLITRSARKHAHGLAIGERAAKRGIEVVELTGDQVRLPRNDNQQAAYAYAKQTLAVVVAPPSKFKLQPIAPSADWRIDLAQGCPAHCSYCYLAGSLQGPPITRVYANLDELLENTRTYLGEGTITSRNAERALEGTTFEASCYTDPLGIEDITGSLTAAISWFGQWEADAQLRFTSKFAHVDPLLTLDHGGRTLMRASVNPAAYRQFEGGTDPVAARLDALVRTARAGYRIGLTIAPIIAASGWREAYGELIEAAAQRFDPLDLDELTIELITHRFTPGSKAVLDTWYPGSKLDMSEYRRRLKYSKFGSHKSVYDADIMRELKSFFYDSIAERMPYARVLYWT
ncbi:MAG: spore photoproduct lyase family protein [Erythrobacter sp.]